MCNKTGPYGRKHWQAIFYLLWTLLGAVAVWRAGKSLASTATPPSFLFEGGGGAPVSVTEQFVRWLKLANLSFRGVYPWLLFAPYVIWLASRFNLVRGHLCLSLPVHLLAGALFVTACHLFTGLVVGRAGLVVIVSGYKPGTVFPWGVLTNQTAAVMASSPGNNLGHAVVPASNGPGVGSELVISHAGKSKTPPSLFQTNGIQSMGPPTNAKGGTSGLSPPAHATATGISSWLRLSRTFSHILSLLAYSSLVGCTHAVQFYRRFRERERRAILLEARWAQARLEALQAQLHPHFLFNALNAAATLVGRDPQGARELLASLGDLLRLALSQSGKPEVSLRDDLQFAERYVAIQQARLGDRLQFKREIEPAVLDCQVPALLVQPLIENAIRHGIEPSSAPGTVRVCARRQGEWLVLRVEDSGAGLTQTETGQSSLGIGLPNLRARMEALYRRRHRLELLPQPAGGVCVEIEIPLRFDTRAAL